MAIKTCEDLKKELKVGCLCCDQCHDHDELINEEYNGEMFTLCCCMLDVLDICKDIQRGIRNAD